MNNSICAKYVDLTNLSPNQFAKSETYANDPLGQGEWVCAEPVSSIFHDEILGYQSGNPNHAEDRICENALEIRTPIIFSFLILKI